MPQFLLQHFVHHAQNLRLYFPAALPLKSPLRGTITIKACAGLQRHPQYAPQAAEHNR